MRRTRAMALSTMAIGALALAGCTAGDSGQGTTITVMYESTDAFTALDDLFQKVKPAFEEANPGVTVELQPVKAGDDDYKTKLQLAHRSAQTAPDVFYEDSYTVQADASAGYLLNLDDYLADWPDWAQYNEAAKAAGNGGDGTYAVPLGLDTRVIWYSKPLLEAAGVTVPWQPTSWQDILDTAEKVKASSPDVVPFNMYIGTGMGEGAATSTILPLLLGTGDGFYDAAAGTWVVGSQGQVDTLAFLQELYDKGYATTPQAALDPNVWQVILGEDFPQSRIGGTVEGSYLPSFWQEGGTYAWPSYETDLGVALFPTQHGDGDQYVSVSGGWTLAVGAGTDEPQLAFDFLAMALSKENALAYAMQNSQLAARDDVAAEPSYLAANPFMEAVSAAVPYTHFRPSNADYPQISVALQKATEDVVVGGVSPEEAAAAYDEAVIALVGEENTTRQ